MKDNMVEMCVRIQPYRCPVCNDEMTFFVTKNNMCIDYKKIFSTYTSSKLLAKFLAEKNVISIRCFKCNRDFFIDWTHGYPIQLTDANMLDKFKLV